MTNSLLYRLNINFNIKFLLASGIDVILALFVS